MSEQRKPFQDIAIPYIDLHTVLMGHGSGTRKAVTTAQQEQNVHFLVYYKKKKLGSIINAGINNQFWWD